MRVTDTHVYFWGSYLSNFYWQPFSVEFDGGLVLDFHTSEQFYMFCKAFYFNDPESARGILKAPDAKAAKAIGRTVKGFDVAVWDAVSYDFMLKACLLKFEAGEKIRQKLFDTGAKIIVEASPIDKIWGVGLHEDDDAILDEANWTGENRLGKVLMEVRNILQEKYDVIY